MDWGRETRSHHLVLWSRNHEYSTPTWKDWSYYQSMGSKFRYGLGKVLGTQNRLTHESALIHCVLRLNLIKGIRYFILKTHSNTHTHTHTHTHKHTSKHTTWHFIPNLTYIYNAYHHITNPSIHLSCFSSHVASYHGRIKQTCYCKPQPCFIIQTKSYSNQCMFMWMHVLPHCIIAPMTSMHDHINACSWYQSKKQRENFNLVC